MEATTPTAVAADALIAPTESFGLSANDARLAAISGFISDIADEVKGLEKDGAHDSQGWRFMSYEQVYRVLKPLLREHNVRLVPVTSSATYEAFGKFRVCTLSVRYVLITPVGSMSIDIVAEGADTSDKATTKAWTYAKKTAYTQLFDLAADIDPDTSGGDVVAAKDDALLGKRVDEAHALADAGNVPALRGLHRATKLLHGRPIKVDVWWNEHETRTTTFGAYLNELGSRIADKV